MTETGMGTWIFAVLAWSLALTVLAEEGFGWALGIRSRWDMTLILLVNLLTNPAVVLICYINILYLDWNQTGLTLLLETAAVIAEGLGYRAAAGNIRHPWIFAVGANVFSFTAGAVLRALV